MKTELQKGIENIHLGISNTAGWTNRLEDAINDVTPNHGLNRRMNIVQRRLHRNEYITAAGRCHQNRCCRCH